MRCPLVVQAARGQWRTLPAGASLETLPAPASSRDPSTGATAHERKSGESGGQFTVPPTGEVKVRGVTLCGGEQVSPQA